MRPTRRFWATAGVGAFSIAFATLTAQPAYLLVSVGVAAWLIAAQWAFVSVLTTADTAITVDHNITPTRTVAKAPVQVALTVDTEQVSADLADARIIDSPPVGAHITAGETTHTVAIGETTTGRYTATFPLAGDYAFSGQVLDLTDQFGLFSETLSINCDTTITIEPRRPQDIHIGEGGDRIAFAAGEHSALHGRQSTRPAELREYQPGDPADRIDWKATARLNDAFVREFEPRGERSTALLIDHRHSSGAGPDGETPLDYMRAVALALTDAARDNDDPLGLQTIGAEGVTNRLPMASTRDHSDRIRRKLSDLSPAAPITSQASRTGPAAATRRAHILDDTESAFAATLRPYFQADGYVIRLQTKPLFNAVRRFVTGLQGQPWIVLFTTDDNRAEVYETVKVARRGNRHVTVFLTPTMLYDYSDPDQLEETYEAYRDFEAFRQRLTRIEDVKAFELAPEGRISRILGGTRSSLTSSS